MEYDRKVTVIAKGLPATSHDEYIISEPNIIVHQVLHEPNIPVVHAKRLINRNDDCPGLVKITID